MRTSKKQRHTLDIARYFARPTPATQANLSYHKALNVQESKDGITPEEAFLLRTDTGKKDFQVTNIASYLALLVGHNSAAMHSKLWAEGFREGTLFMADFDGAPGHVREFAQKALEASLSKRYSNIKSIGLSESFIFALKKVKGLK